MYLNTYINNLNICLIQESNLSSSDVFPENINLLTYEKLSSDSKGSRHLIRLEHFYENGEDEEFSLKVIIPVQVSRLLFINTSLEIVTN